VGERVPGKSVEKVAVKIERQVGNEQLGVGELVEGCGARDRRGNSVDRDGGGRKRLFDFDPRFNVQEQLPNNHILNSIARNSNEKSYQTMSGYLEPSETQTPSAHTPKVVSTSEKVVPGLSMGTDPDFKNIFSKHSPKNPSLNAHNPISFTHQTRSETDQSEGTHALSNIQNHIIQTGGSELTGIDNIICSY
jgi:hypothetical protein